MRGKSHRCLGQYLVRRYMSDHPQRNTRAFLLGCIQPDRNPATYLKGSLRCQWLRGHNYPNAERFMHRLSRRLEKKDTLNLFDYYSLGKLIHYTADAFTLAHNAAFPTDLDAHRDYEAALQEHFIRYLREEPTVEHRSGKCIMDTIGSYHRQYEYAGAGIRTDAQFALAACCCVVSLLFTKRIM